MEKTAQQQLIRALSETTIELIAVIVAVNAGDPRVLTISNGSALPSGPFEMVHRSLQAGLRLWVKEQTHHALGYMEQLYTFADRERTATTQRHISISYLGLTREARDADGTDACWQSWYRFFPWEDRRAGVPDVMHDITAQLNAWADAAATEYDRSQRRRRVMIAFGLNGVSWNEELALQRYQLLWEAGLVAETGIPAPLITGVAMTHDHRRILATGITRLRAKIKYRPVVFELMPPEFTFLDLQRAVEALAGRLLHKQNFRRMIEQQELIEETGQETRGAGRPARLFRFRREVVDERAVTGSKLPLARN